MKSEWKWKLSEKGNSYWRKDIFNNTYIVTYRRASGFTMNRALDLRVIYRDGTQKYFSHHEVTKFTGTVIAGRGLSPSGDQSASERNGNRLSTRYKKSKIQNNVFGWIDDIILKKEKSG